MIVQTFSAQAEAAAQRYGALVEGWRGLYHRALDSADFGSHRAMEDLHRAAYELAHLFLAREEDAIEDAFDEIASEAHTATRAALRIDDAQELSDDVSAHAQALGSYLRSEIAIQIERDIAFLRHAVERTRLQVSVGARAQGVPMRAALMAHRLTGANEPTFFFHDRRSQKWPSRKFIRAVWRQNALAVYNETVLMTLAEHGEQIAVVTHINPDAEAHGIEMALADNTSLPTYADLRDQIFHPNADCILCAREPV